MRKHVKPAHPGAAIPDTVRRRDLPPEGYVVDWSPRWERLANRGDILVTDAAEAVQETVAAAAPSAESPHVGG